MVKRKFNYKRFGIAIVILLCIIFGIIYAIKSLIAKIEYQKTYEYKFTQIGYDLEEITFLTNKYDAKTLDELLKKEYNENIILFSKEKYFMYKNLDKYIEYQEKNNNKNISDIVATINTNANVEWIDETYDTDTSKNELMLVNRLYGLKSDYKPTDLTEVPLDYSTSGIKIDRIALDAVIPLIGEAKKQGYTFILTSGYRSYEEQEKIYNSYVDSYGEMEADEKVARPGHSEYQTGLSFDLEPYGVIIEDLNTSPEYAWLRENAHKFGFIFRFEKNKQELTQFPSYTWRLRYVGKTASSLIYSEGICFEEYYAYFVEEE